MKSVRLFPAAAACALALSSCAFGQATGSLSVLALQPSGYGGTLTRGLIQASDGNFYTSPQNSSYVFRITPAGSISSLKGQIDASCGQGIQSGLIEGPDGDLYGITNGGGTNGYGVFFSFSLATKTCTGIYNLAQADGNELAGPLTLGADGNFYGVFYYGGANNQGEAFRITPAGVFTDIYDFDAVSGGGDGENPGGALFQASDGNWYGVTHNGVTGANDGGLFQLVPGTTTPWVETVFFGFDSGAGYNSQGVNEWTDGNLYGVNAYGATGYGSIWESDLFDNNPNGDFFTLPGGGDQSQSNIFLAGDGNFYSALSSYSGAPDGSFFSFNPGTSKYTDLVDFPANSGAPITPVGPVIQGSDGNFYGDAGVVGSSAGGYYKLAVTPAVPTNLAVTVNKTTLSAGQSVTVSWTVKNVTNDTAAQCYAYPYIQQGGFNVATATAGAWTGKLSSTISNFTMSGSKTVTPTEDGAYVYAVECQGSLAALSPAVTVSGTAAAATSTTLTANPNPVIYGSQVTFTATVKETSGSNTPTGSVTFTAYGQTLATVNLSNGVATLKANAVGYPANTYAVQAKYNGDSGDETSTSNTVNLALDYGTSTTVSVTPSSGPVGTTFKLSATVAQTTGTGTAKPTGSVTFYADGQALITVGLSGGAASFSASSNGYPAGTYSITAKYNGSSTDIKSTSTSSSVTLTK